MRATELRIDHLAFPSFDAGETFRFYTEVMGFRLAFAVDGESAEWGNKTYLMTGFTRGNVAIDFFEIDGTERPPPDGLPRDIRHVALAVGSRAELSAWRQRLETHGVPYWVEDHGGAPSIYFSDPNGIIIEINAHSHEPPDADAAAEALAVVRRWTATRGQREIP